jgi:hypothetical protein
MNFIFFILLYFLFIFGPVLNSLGVWADLILFLSIVIIILNFKKIHQLKGANFFYIFILLYFVVSIRSLFYDKINPLQWLAFVFRPIRILLTLFAGFIIVLITEKKMKEDLLQNILKFIYLSIFLHGFIMILQFFNPDFKSFVYQYTTTGEFRSTFEFDFRMGGLSGSSGGAVLSVVQSIGILILPFLLRMTNSIFKKFVYIIYVVPIIFSIIISGRSGIYAIMIFLPISLVINYDILKTIRVTIISITIFLFIFLITYNNLNYFENSGFYYAFNRTFESFITYKEEQQIKEETTMALLDHIIFPDLFTLLWGSNDAVFNTQFDRNVDSDIGYIKSLFGFGFFGFLAYYSPVFYFLKYTYRNIDISLSFKLLFLLIVIMIFFELKESFLYVRMFWSIISLIIGYNFFISRKREIY